MKKENSIQTVLLIIFVVLTLVLGGFIIYDKFIAKKEEISNSVDNTKVNDSNKNNLNLPEWAEYLLNQNIDEIIYEGYGKNSECVKEQVTKDQFKEFLKKLTSGKLRKFDIGGAGGDCNQGVTVKYGEKEVSFYHGTIIDVEGTDPVIISLLEKEKYDYEKPNNDYPSMVFEYTFDIRPTDKFFK